MHVSIAQKDRYHIMVHGINQKNLKGCRAMRKMGLNRDYRSDDPNFTGHTVHEKVLKRFKVWCIIAHGKTVNEVLDKALEHDVKYRIVQSVGHHSRCYIFQHIEKWINQQNLFCHWSYHGQKQKELKQPRRARVDYGLCLLVNLDDYYKI